MSGNSVVLDSNVIIFGSKDMIDIEKVVSMYDKQYVSIISYMEVYAFDFNESEEKRSLDKIFGNLQIVETSKDIADIAIIYRKSKTKKIKLPDAIIIATAKHLGADLLTNNLSDFQGVDASVSVTGIEDLRI